MRIYLDMCSLQRPLDDDSQLRVRLEAGAIVEIIGFIEAGKAELVSSVALNYENDRGSDPTRRDHVRDLLAGATQHIPLSATVEQQAALFIKAGIKTLDALHLACAVAADVAYFCTCDDRLLKRGRTLLTKNVKVVSPLELITELGL